MSTPLTIEGIMLGGAKERIEDAIAQCIQNIVDPNTSAKKAREVLVKIKIIPNEQRNVAALSVDAVAKLQSPVPLETSITIGHDPRTGVVEASELSSGENPAQHTLEGTMENGKIVNFKHAQGGV